MDERQSNDRTDEAQEKRKSHSWDIRPYVAIGLTIFLVAAAAMVFFFFLFRFQGFFSGIDLLIASLQSVIIGLIIAYLANPIVNFFERHIIKRLSTRIEDEKKCAKTARGLSILAALAVVIAILCLLLGTLIPSLIQSLVSVSMSLPNKISHFTAWMNSMTTGDNEIERLLENLLNSAEDYVTKFIKEDLPAKAQTIILQVTTGMISIGKFLLNVVIGFIVSVYVLFDKEKVCAQSKKILYAIIRPRTANEIVEVVRKSNEIFIGFIVGKIIDSVIIGFLTYIILLIVGLPYAMLISVIVGVTNVIPFFGPFIGAIPSAILLLLDDPINGLYFLIIILIIQQLDGNIIGPKILGNSTGLSSFWVIVAILVGSGMFGFVGMLLGVPVFAVLYYLASRLIQYILRRKQYPEDTAAYTDISHYDLETKTFVTKNAEEKKPVVPHPKFLLKIVETVKKKVSKDD